jgi:hypothetical protein
MKKSKRIVITVPLYLKDKLKRIADDYSCSQSEIMRMALVKMIETERGL